MAKDHLYTVDGSTATPASRISLSDAGLREREHLQEWVLAHPEILGDDVRIVTFEFDRWITGAGEATWERLDVLALDRAGRLVLAELKRGRAPDAVMVQALNYAAMASRFNLDELVEVFGTHGASQTSAEGVIEELRDWAPSLSDESLSPPRIVLIAEDFGPVLTNTAMFLIEQGLDLRLIRAQLYRLGETLALTTSQVLPVPEAEEFMVRPRSGAPTQRATRAAAKRRASIPERLVASGIFTEGEELHIVVPPGVGEDREAVSTWLAQEPTRKLVRWHNDPATPLEWAADGQRHNMTTLIRTIVETATGEPPRTQVWGPNWYRSGDGEVLYKIAETLPDEAGPGQLRFDWAQLHQILDALPPGRWTTYGDLAELVGTGALALGRHLSDCPHCPNAHRVLGADGRSRPNFRWEAPADTRSQQSALEEEGVTFTDNRADPALRLSSSGLRQLIEQ
ncbi:MAG: MGMT family protein [Actinomycetota bacterium]|nr:MGMT family protein [Actinomycetota bacterium]